jgi:cobalt-zinc-cadmium efflux system outer membrane protein
MKTSLYLSLLILLGPAWAQGSTSDNATTLPPDLPGMVAYALNHHPALQAARYRQDASRERIEASGWLPDPMVVYGYYAQATDKRQSVEVAQSIPWPGRLSRETAVAREAAQASDYMTWVATDEVVLAVRRDYAELVYVRRAEAIYQENIALLEQLESIIEQRVASNLANQADLLRVEIEKARLEEDWFSLHSLKEPAIARLNASLGREQSAPVPEAVTLPETPLLPDDMLPELEARMRAENPQLLNLRAVTRVQQARTRLAETEALPDFMVGAEWMDGIGMRDEVKVMVGMSIPLWQSRSRALVNEARAERRAAEAEYRYRHQNLDTAWQTAVYAWRDARRKVHLYRDRLIPRATQTLEVETRAYQSGETDFINLIDAQRTYLDFVLLLARSESDLLQAEATLLNLAGQRP